MTLSLHPIQATQIELIANWAIAEGWPGRDKQVKLNTAEFSELLNLPGHFSFCMSEFNKPPVGFGQVWVSSVGVVSLVRVIVDPSIRGRGLGKQLCALLLNEALKLSASGFVKLRVSRSNTAAVAAYSSLGFRVLEAESNQDVCAMAVG